MIRYRGLEEAFILTRFPEGINIASGEDSAKSDSPNGC